MAGWLAFSACSQGSVSWILSNVLQKNVHFWPLLIERTVLKPVLRDACDCATKQWLFPKLICMFLLVFRFYLCSRQMAQPLKAKAHNQPDKILFLYFKSCVCVCACATISIDAHRGLKRALVILELELVAVMSRLVWVQGRELRSSARAVCVLGAEPSLLLPNISHQKCIRSCKGDRVF